MAKVDRKLTREYSYWSGEIMAMKYLLLNIDRLLGKRKTNDRDLSDLLELFERVGDKRKENFDFFWSEIWKEELDESE